MAVGFPLLSKQVVCVSKTSNKEMGKQTNGKGKEMTEEQINNLITLAIDRAFKAGQSFEKERLVFLLENDPVITAWFNAEDLARLTKLVRRD